MVTSMADAVRWRVLVVDDEPAARRGVRQLLAPFPQFEVVGECRDGNEALAAIDALAPHVLFLDVQMPEAGGFDVLRRRAPRPMPATVFLTAYDRHAIAAFEAEAYDYLVKPVSEARFAITIERLLRRLGAPDGPDAPRGVIVPTPRGAIVVPLREIDWIEAADNYARVWTGGRSHLIRESLAELEAWMRPHGFERAHRQALVRLAAVRRLVASRDGGTVLVLESGVRIPVSRRRRAAIARAVRGV
jgi:two-component system LytT family response regulator